MDGGRVLAGASCHESWLHASPPHAGRGAGGAGHRHPVCPLSALSPWEIPVLNLFVGNGNPCSCCSSRPLFLWARSRNWPTRTCAARARALNIGQTMITQFFTVPDSLQGGGRSGTARTRSRTSCPWSTVSMHFRGMVNREQLLQANRELPAEALGPQPLSRCPGPASGRLPGKRSGYDAAVSRNPFCP